MSKSVLKVIQHPQQRERYCIAWFFGTEMGAILCESKEDGLEEGPPDTSKDSWEHWMACKTALENRDEDSNARYTWPTEAKAKRVLRIINVALKQERKMPEWATTALRNGWKPPKNWKA